MSPFRTGKDKISLEEIKNILKSNLNLYMSVYKNDPDFIDYFIDLTLYLLRYKYDRADELLTQEPTNESELPEPNHRIVQSGQIINPGPTKQKYCHFCGAELQGQRKCPVCGNIND